MYKITKKSLIVLAFIIFLPATCVALVTEQGTWCYKMTVTVETPEGLITGSAVREVRVQRGWSPLSEMRPKVSLRGEAVVVDLGERGVLFALLKGAGLGGTDYASRLPFYVFPSPRGGTTPEGIRYYSNLKAGPVELEPNWYPNLVYFKDINDPESVAGARDFISCSSEHKECGTRTRGGIHFDTMEDAFGSGVKLKSITIEMTKEAVTRGIVDRYLPWLEERLHLGRVPEGSRLTGQMGAAMFKTRE